MAYGYHLTQLQRDRIVSRARLEGATVVLVGVSVALALCWLAWWMARGS